ncbi:DUF5684 domain-containing protein [Microbacterium invictum]|uniref:FHA domain-containing protein n=1 Tax=Microbacterium invictum TaxID=515415 RepID=A0AA40VN92_9MICO|nr:MULTISPECIES: DUF5684 domain-containing protein [Microbacterium]MBB4140148.1 hypothetical protein [Microbacterium invictum]
MTTADESLSALVILLSLVIGVALYIWTALALSAMFRKMGEDAWKGWVPFLNQATVLKWGGFSPWLVLLTLTGAGVIVVWILMIIAAHRINPGFGYGGSMTVLAALLFVVWASILGFGPARWLGARLGGPVPVRPPVPRSDDARTAAVFAPPVATGPEAAPVGTSSWMPPAAPDAAASPAAREAPVAEASGPARVGAAGWPAPAPGSDTPAPGSGTPGPVRSGADGGPAWPAPGAGRAAAGPARAGAAPAGGTEAWPAPGESSGAWPAPESSSAPSVDPAPGFSPAPRRDERAPATPASGHVNAHRDAPSFPGGGTYGPGSDSASDAGAIPASDAGAIPATDPGASRAGSRAAEPAPRTAPIVPLPRAADAPPPASTTDSFAPRPRHEVTDVPTESVDADESVDAWGSEIDEVSAVSPSPFPPSAAGTRPYIGTPVDTTGDPISFVPGRRAAVPPQGDSPVTRMPAVPPAERRVREWPASHYDPDVFPEMSGEVSAVVGSPAAGAPLSARRSVPAQEETPGAASGSESASGEEAVDDEFDHTVIARRKRPAWQLIPASGRPIALTSDVVILGRQPAPDPARPRAQLVALDDRTRTVSKTHARLELHADGWQLTDLHSTNGVLLPTVLGTEIEIEPGSTVPAGDRFLLGDAELRLTRGDA